MNDRRLLRIDEASQRLSVGRSTMYAMVAAGKIPSLRLGRSRSLRIPADALDRWLTEESERQASARLVAAAPATVSTESQSRESNGEPGNAAGVDPATPVEQSRLAIQFEGGTS